MDSEKRLWLDITALTKDMSKNIISLWHEVRYGGSLPYKEDKAPYPYWYVDPQEGLKRVIRDIKQENGLLKKGKIPSTQLGCIDLKEKISNYHYGFQEKWYSDKSFKRLGEQFSSPMIGKILSCMYSGSWNQKEEEVEEKMPGYLSWYHLSGPLWNTLNSQWWLKGRTGLVWSQMLNSQESLRWPWSKLVKKHIKRFEYRENLNPKEIRNMKWYTPTLEPSIITSIACNDVLSDWKTITSFTSRKDMLNTLNSSWETHQKKNGNETKWRFTLGRSKIKISPSNGNK